MVWRTSGQETSDGDYEAMVLRAQRGAIMWGASRRRRMIAEGEARTLEEAKAAAEDAIARHKAREAG